jgi:membrane-associated protein
MSFIVDGLSGLPPGVVYLVVGLLVFGEAACFLGFVLPGETAVIVGGFIASEGKVNVVALCVVVVIAAVVGDSAGYLVGTRYGTRLLELKVLSKRRAGIDRALLGLERRGATYVFIGRFTAFFRAVVPGLAGMSHLPYRRFFPANAAGGICWGVGYTLLGYFAGHAYKKVESYSTYAAIGVAVLVVGLVVVLTLRARRRERRVEQASVAEGPERELGARTQEPPEHGPPAPSDPAGP